MILLFSEMRTDDAMCTSIQINATCTSEFEPHPRVVKIQLKVLNSVTNLKGMLFFIWSCHYIAKFGAFLYIQK